MQVNPAYFSPKYVMTNTSMLQSQQRHISSSLLVSHGLRMQEKATSVQSVLYTSLHY